MPRTRTVVVSSSALLAASVALFFHFAGKRSPGESELFEPPAHAVQPEPLCPWRNPETDMARMFPSANRRAAETRILSGSRVELSKLLGRPLTAGEHSLTFSRVFKDSQPVGVVVPWRVKGAYGAIELVLATSPEGAVRHVILQRSREPEAIARALDNPDWLGRFTGRTRTRGWETDDTTSLPAEARASATAVRDGIRDLLILLEGSEHAPRSAGVTAHD